MTFMDFAVTLNFWFLAFMVILAFAIGYIWASSRGSGRSFR